MIMLPLSDADLLGKQKATLKSRVVVDCPAARGSFYSIDVTLEK